MQSQAASKNSLGLLLTHDGRDRGGHVGPFTLKVESPSNSAGTTLKTVVTSPDRWYHPQPTADLRYRRLALKVENLKGYSAVAKKMKLVLKL